MAKSERNWHPDFIKYMDEIINHPNYEGLPIAQKKDGSWSWISTAKSSIGQARIAWCEKKASELGFPIEAGVYAKVMREIHPTKWKVCQVCGKEMSIYYHYPSINCLKKIHKQFGILYTETDHINDIWDHLITNGFSSKEIAHFFIEYGNLNITKTDKNIVINALESLCRNEGKAILSPGAMSNFPDRFDGFHTYNRCCRAEQDTGRSKENLKSYTKDRRAYEYWSDGNIHAANLFMGSSFFSNTTADHVGPISLGFVHDPRYLRPMAGSDNSAKRDRLQFTDVENIINIEKQTHVYPMSWYSEKIWEYIKTNYKQYPEQIPTAYRDALKQNMANYMFILWNIIQQCGKNGISFLFENLLKPKYKYFLFHYTFDENGVIIERSPRHLTERISGELDRYKRIAIESVFDFHEKENRNTKNNLTSEELFSLNHYLCSSINNHHFEIAMKEFILLVSQIQDRIISKM